MIMSSVVTDTVYGVDYDWDGSGTNLGGEAQIYDYSSLTNILKEKDITVVVAADLLSLSLLKPPGLL